MYLHSSDNKAIAVPGNSNLMGLVGFFGKVRSVNRLANTIYAISHHALVSVSEDVIKYEKKRAISS